LRPARIKVAAGRPAGVVNFLANARADAGPVVGAIIAHPTVCRINFIGSTRLARLSPPLRPNISNHKYVGAWGSAPLIVLNDAGEQSDKTGASAKQRRQAAGVTLRSAHRSFPYSRGGAAGVERRSR